MARRAAAAFALAIALPLAVGPATGASAPPNIVVIETDDQSLGMLGERTMPHVLRLIGERGTAFTDFVNEPLCCPSRAGLITGQYPHNSGVISNDPGYGSLRAKHNTLPVWLGRAGYRTALVGKFLNGYAAAEGTRPAPGFDRWFALLKHRYYHTPISAGGEAIVLRGNTGHDYVTNVLTRRATDFVRRSAGSGRPFFLWLAELAPHQAPGFHPPECSRRAGPVPAPGDAGKFAEEPLPNPPSFDETDVSDKPIFVRDLAPLGDEDVQRITDWYRCALESLGAVDRGVGRVVSALRASNELRRTVLVFTSDNGFLYGEHRMRRKGSAYEEVVHLPLLVRMPPGLLGGAAPPRSLGAPVAGIDLTPTILDLAGARPCSRAHHCRRLDGRSLLPLLGRDAAGWPPDRGILVQVAEGAATESGACRIRAIRTPNRMYAEYPSVLDPATGQCVPSADADLYDLQADPFQLDNLLFTDPQGSAALRTELQARLDALRRCAGTEGDHPCE